MKKLASIVFLTTSLFANPSGGEVVHGNVNIKNTNHRTLHIHTGHKSIINWKDFSISEGELTKFIQANANSAVLNRVKGENLSRIMGRLESNGIVYLINPYGVIVGKNAVIDTGAFLASTFDIPDEKFLRSSELLFEGDSQGAIINLGTINAWDGDVTLIGYRVKNEGNIESPHGVTSLASGMSILYKPAGKERIFIRGRGEGKEGTGVRNSGEIAAAQVELKADGNIYEYAIRDDGVIHATGVQHKEGRVLLVAEGGKNLVTGKIAAKNHDDTGGTVHLLGKQVGLYEEGVIDVSGKYGGGTALIGGDYKGSNPHIPNAEGTFFGDQAEIYANALEKGDGGKVILWSDHATRGYGKIRAQGGLQSGDGGFVEVCGGYLDFKADVNTLSPNGVGGTLLLDPIELTVSSGATTNVTAAPNFSPTAAPSNLLDTDLVASWNGNALTTVQTSTAGAGTGNLTVDNSANVTYSGAASTGNALSLIAPIGGDVIVNGTIDNSNSAGLVTLQSLQGQVRIEGTTTPNPGVGAVVLTGSNDIIIDAFTNVNIAGSTGGAANEFVEVLSNQGNILITAQTGTVTVQGGDSNSNYALINTDLGSVFVASAGQVQVLGGSASGASAEVHAERLPSVTSVVASTGGVSVIGGSAANCYARIGHPGLSGITLDAPINVTANNGDIIVRGGTGASSYAHIGCGSPVNVPMGVDVYTGDVTVTADQGNVTVGGTIGPPGTNSYSHIGHHAGVAGFNNKQVVIGTFVPPTFGGIPTSPATTTVVAPLGTVTVEGGSNGGTFALIGYGARGFGGGAAFGQFDLYYGDVFVRSNLFDVQGGSGNDTFGVIGYGSGAESNGSCVGYFDNIDVRSTSTTLTSTVTGGTGAISSTCGAIGVAYQGALPNVLEIFNLGLFGPVTPGTIRVQIGGNLTITGGSGSANPAAITMGFTYAGGSDLVGGSNIFVDVGGNLTCTAGSANSHAEITTARGSTLTNPIPINFVLPVSLTINAANATFNGSTTDASQAIANQGSFGGTFDMNIAGNMLMQANSGRCDFDGNGPTTILVGNNFTSQGTSSNLFDVTRGRWEINAGNHVTISDGSRFTHSGPGGPFDMEFFAGHSMFLTTNDPTNPTMLTKSVDGQLNLVVDNNFPTAPLIGPGGFTIDSLTTITHTGASDELRIYTATPFQNSIAGIFNLNGGTFLLGPLLVNTSQQTWCAYYNNPAFVSLFMIFYKVCDFGEIFQNSSAPIVTVELLRDLHPYDEYLGWPIYFDYFYRGMPERSPIPYFMRSDKRFDKVPKDKKVEVFDGIIKTL